MKEFNINVEDDLIISKSGTYHLFYNKLLTVNILIKDNITVNIIEHYNFLKEANFVQNIEILNNSKVFYNLLHFSNSYNKKINIKVNNSYLKTYLTDFNRTNSFYNIDLIAGGAEVEFNLLVYLNSNKGQNQNLKINHLAKHTNSKTNNYIILNDSSNCNLEVESFVYKDAFKSTAYQINKAVILNKLSKCLISPKLKFDCFDVLGSHSATIGKVSNADLYYIQSRGITVKEAKRLIVLGYFLQKCPIYLTEVITKEIERRLA